MVYFGLIKYISEDMGNLDEIPIDYLTISQFQSITQSCDDVIIRHTETTWQPDDAHDFLLCEIIKDNKDACSEIVKVGNLDSLKYLCERGYIVSKEQCCYEAAKTGQLECLKYLCDNGAKPGSCCMMIACYRGEYQCVQYLISIGCQMTKYCIGYAAMRGRLDCVKLLHEHGCPCDTTMFTKVGFDVEAKCKEFLTQNSSS